MPDGFRFAEQRGSRTAFYALLLLVLLTVATRSAAGQEPAPIEPLALVQQASSKADAADSAADFTNIIELLDRALAGDLPAAKAPFAHRLRAWALNRRGERRAEAADKALAEQDAQQAKRLDEAAAADFSAAVKDDPKHFKAWHNKSVSLAQEGKYQEALADFAKALDLKSDYPNTWFNRAEIYFTLEQFEKALSDYNRVLALSPKDAGALAGRGRARFQLGRYSEALADFDQVIALSPKDAVLRADRGDTYESLGKWEQAAADYRQAIALDAKLARAQESAAWLLATCPDARVRNAAQAMEAAQKAIELLGETPDTLDALAAAQANANRFDEAQATLAKALKNVPADIAERLKERLALYKSRRPYRQETP